MAHNKNHGKTVDLIARALTLGQQQRHKKMQEKKKQIRKISQIQTRAKAGKPLISTPASIRIKSTKTPDATIKSTSSQRRQWRKWYEKERQKQQILQ